MTLLNDKKQIVLICLAALLAGCLGPVQELYPEEEELRPIPVFLVRHGWHVGLVVETEYVIEKIPSHEAIPDTRYLKFGWGDNRYYPDEDAGFLLMMRAALLPTRSVIHVVGIDIPVENYFPGSDVIRVQISKEGMEEMGSFIADRFRRTDEGEIEYAADGRYTRSAFYRANGLYFIPKTSNTWTARALRRAGCPITPLYTVTSGNVISQTKNFGDIIQERN